MATLKESFEKYMTFYVIGGMAVVMGLFWAVNVYFATPHEASRSNASTAVQPGGQSGASLGTTEGNAEFMKKFQERVISDMNKGLEDARKDTQTGMEMFKRNLEEAQNTKLDQIKQELLEVVRPASQQEQPQRSVQVEGFSIKSTTGQAASKDGGFLASPSELLQSIEPKGAAGEGADAERAEAALPPNGFIEGKLLNGVVAKAGEWSSTMLISLTGRYQSANGFVVNLDGCTVHAQGRAELSAGRIMGKPAKMTCNFPGKVTQTWDIAGTLIDEDGIEGIRGIIVDNGGKKLTGAALAAAIAAAGTALSRQQTQT